MDDKTGAIDLDLFLKILMDGQAELKKRIDELKKNNNNNICEDKKNESSTSDNRDNTRS